MGEIVGLLLTGAIVTYFLVIFMGAILPDVFVVIDSAVGVELATSIKFLLGAMTFFVVVGLVFKAWGILTGGGSSQPLN